MKIGLYTLAVPENRYALLAHEIRQISDLRGGECLVAAQELLLNIHGPENRLILNVVDGLRLDHFIGFCNEMGILAEKLEE